EFRRVLFRSGLLDKGHRVGDREPNSSADLVDGVRDRVLVNCDRDVDIDGGARLAPHRIGNSADHQVIDLQALEKGDDLGERLLENGHRETCFRIRCRQITPLASTGRSRTAVGRISYSAPIASRAAADPSTVGCVDSQCAYRSRDVARRRTRSWNASSKATGPL